MTYNVGTATDYIDLLDQLIQVASGRHLSTVAINAAGANYLAGEILAISGTGATATHVAQIEVVTVSGGAITAARVYRGGAYTVDPTTTTANVSTSTGFTFDGTATTPGTGATFDLVFAATGWTQLAREEQAASTVIAAGGTGYTNGSTDVLTVIGGVLANGGSAATFTATVSGGIVTSAALLSAGDYEVAPSSPALTSVSPGGGTGCTLTVTWADVSGDTVVVLQGDAGSAIDPLVGIKTYSSETDETGLNTVYNWALFGMTAWSSLSALHDQANISPGFSVADDGTITTSTTGDGAFMPLKDSAGIAIDWFLSVTGRRIALVCRVEGSVTVHYPQASFGLLNPFGITSELPFPAYVLGSSDRKRAWFRDSGSVFGGMSEVIERNNGPCFVWAPEGAWIAPKAAVVGSNISLAVSFTAENDVPRAMFWPLATSAVTAETDDKIWAAAGGLGFDSDDLTLASSPISIYRTPDTGGDLFPLFPVTIVQADSATDFYRVFGEIEGVFWFHEAGAGISSQDRFTQASDSYGIFQNGTRTQPFSFLAFRED